MKQKTNHLLIGLFVLASTALAVGIAIFVGVGALDKDDLILETYFTESVQGLDVGAHVRFRGVKLGQVREITLTNLEYESDLPYVLVRFAIRPIERNMPLHNLGDLINARLGEGLRIQAATQGLTGVLYLEADLYENAIKDYPPLPHDWTPRYRYVPTIPSTIVQISSALENVLGGLQETDFAGIIREGRSTVSAMQATFASIDAGRLQGRLESTLNRVDDSVQRLTDRLDNLLASTETTLGQLNERVRTVPPTAIADTLAALQNAAAKVGPTVESAETTFTSLQRSIDTLTAEVTQTLSTTDATLASLRTTVDSNGSTLRGVLLSAQRATDSLARLASTLEQYPSLLLLSDPPPPRIRR